MSGAGPVLDVDDLIASERESLRWGAVCAIAGGLLAIIGNVLHPRPEPTQILDPAAYVHEVADAPLWVFAHVDLIVVSILFLLAWVALAHSISTSRAAGLARFALAVALVDTIVHIITLIIDGVVMRNAADAYLTTPVDSQPAALAAFGALFQLLFGLFDGWELLWGFTFVLFGLAVVRSGSYPAWLGWIGVVGGVVLSAIGLTDIVIGSTELTFLALFPAAAAIVSVWLMAVGVLMWKRASHLSIATTNRRLP